MWSRREVKARDRQTDRHSAVLVWLNPSARNSHYKSTQVGTYRHWCGPHDQSFQHSLPSCLGNGPIRHGGGGAWLCRVPYTKLAAASDKVIIHTLPVCLSNTHTHCYHASLISLHPYIISLKHSPR